MLITIAGVDGATQLNGNSYVVQYIEPVARIVTLAGLDATGGNTATFTAYVKKFNSQGAVDQAIQRSAALRISGAITWA